MTRCRSRTPSRCCSSCRWACCSIPSVLVREPLAVLAVLAIIMVGKSLAAFVIVLVFRHPVRTALTVSASLAQIGEFSFILASLGAALGLLPADGRDLILAGALLSIALNPVTFAGIAPLTRWLEARPQTAGAARAARRRAASHSREQRRRVCATTPSSWATGASAAPSAPVLKAAGIAVRGHRARSPDAGHGAVAGHSHHRRRRRRARECSTPPASNMRACSWSRRPTVSRRAASSKSRTS